MKLALALCQWFDPPLILSDKQTVHQVLDSINAHPLVQDETAQDYVMPPKRYAEKPGRFRIWGENQDNFYCFVEATAVEKVDPPVYFETCLDLVLDCNVAESDVLPGNVAMVTDSFQSFIGFMLAHHICLRLEKGPYLGKDVNGIVFAEPLHDCAGLVNPLGRPFFAGYSPYIGNGIICIPHWGAAFRNFERRSFFANCKQPKIGQTWA